MFLLAFGPWQLSCLVVWDTVVQSLPGTTPASSVLIDQMSMISFFFFPVCVCFGNLYSWRKSGSDRFPVSFPTCVLWVIIFPCSQAASLHAVSLMKWFLPSFWIPSRDTEQWGKDFSGRYKAQLCLKTQSLLKKRKKKKKVCEKDHERQYVGF